MFTLNYKSKLLERLVLETIQSRITVKESIEYVINHFHKLGNTDFAFSQSYYEKLRKVVKEKIESGEIDLDKKPIDLSSDNEKINELIEIYFMKIQNESIKPEHKGNSFEIGEQIIDFQSWSKINEFSNILMKLIQLKNKIT